MYTHKKHTFNVYVYNINTCTHTQKKKHGMCAECTCIASISKEEEEMSKEVSFAMHMQKRPQKRGLFWDNTPETNVPTRNVCTKKKVGSFERIQASFAKCRVVTGKYRGVCVCVCTEHAMCVPNTQRVYHTHILPLQCVMTPQNSCKQALYLSKRAPYSSKSALNFLERALYSPKRALNSFKKGPIFSKSPRFSQKSSTFSPKSLIL